MIQNKQTKKIISFFAVALLMGYFAVPCFAVNKTADMVKVGFYKLNCVFHYNTDGTKYDDKVGYLNEIVKKLGWIHKYVSVNSQGNGMSMATVSLNKTYIDNSPKEVNQLYKNTSMIITVSTIIVEIIIGMLIILCLCSICYKKLKQKSKESEKANAAKSNFLSRVSHDMRTPMNGILGLAHLIQEKDDIDEIKADVRQIEQSGQFLLRLINDTLDMNKIEQDKLELNPSAVEGKTVFNNVLGIIMPMVKEKNIKLHVETPNIQWTTLFIDYARVQQIIVNLLSNAVKFTPNGGRIDIILENIAIKNGAMHDRIVVRDTGIGMSKEFLPHIFEPFSQEHCQSCCQSCTYNMGTGLGMTIVKRLVEMMGGEIQVKSQQGKGTEFIITIDFPIATETQMKQLKNKENIDESVLKGSRILLCEDHPLNAQIAVKILEKKGCIVTHATNGKIGVEMFQASKIGYYNAILMDVRMPVMDGLEATRQIRALDRPEAKTVPIIAMTANAFDEDVKTNFAAGMNAHLGKPFDPQKLYQMLAEQILTNHCNV